MDNWGLQRRIQTFFFSLLFFLRAVGDGRKSPARRCAYNGLRQTMQSRRDGLQLPPNWVMGMPHAASIITASIQLPLTPPIHFLALHTGYLIHGRVRKLPRCQKSPLSNPTSLRSTPALSSSEQTMSSTKSELDLASLYVNPFHPKTPSYTPNARY